MWAYLQATIQNVFKLGRGVSQFTAGSERYQQTLDRWSASSAAFSWIGTYRHLEILVYSKEAIGILAKFFSTLRQNAQRRRASSLTSLAL